MDPQDVATRFETQAPGKIDPSQVTGFIDVEEKGKNYSTVTQHAPNSHGQLEYKIVKPIVWVKDLRPNPRESTAPAVMIVPGLLEIYERCP